MIRISSETELLEAFRPADRAEVQLPEDLRFPLDVKDYYAWVEPSGARVFLVFSEGHDRPALGIAFRRDQAAGGHAPGMCEWCHSVRGGGAVRLLTAAASSQKRIGISLCSDLSCKEKAEAAPGPDDVPSLESSRQRVRRIVQRMSEFARRNLF